MFNGDYDFPLRMALFKIAESLSRIAQRITSIDEGRNFSSSKKILQKNQILLVYIRDDETDLLVPDP